MMTALVVAAALLLDATLGEPHRYHPLVGFGRLAQALSHIDSQIKETCTCFTVA